MNLTIHSEYINKCLNEVICCRQNVQNVQNVQSQQWIYETEKGK